MTLERSIIENIQTSNYQKLRNYFLQWKPQNSLPDQILDFAGQQFLKSNKSTISNSYGIFQLLTPYINQVNLTLFQAQSSYIKKYAEYEEHKLNRNIIQILDSKIEKDYIFPIKYPKNTSFIRKLLHLPPKRNSFDILVDFKHNLPEMMSKLTEEIMNNDRLNVQSSRAIISREKLNSLIYERITLKAAKQLKLDRLVVSKVFEERNRKECVIISDKLELISKAKKVDHEEAINVIKNQLHKLVPPYMIEELGIIPLYVNNSKLNPLVQATINNEIKKLFQKHMQFVEQDLLDKQSKGLDKDSIVILQNLSKVGKNNIIEERQSLSYEEKLEAAQNKFYDSLYKKAQDSRFDKKKKLNKFEKEGIDLLRRTDKLNQVEKHYLSKFIEYATDNKELNRRLGLLIKNNDILAKSYPYIIEGIYKYSYKTSNLSQIRNSSAKLRNILDKYNQDPNTIFSLEEKISLKEVGQIMRFCDGSVTNTLNMLNHTEEEKEIKELWSIYRDSEVVWNRFRDTLGREIKIKDGELIMDVAKQYHDINNHKKSLQSWIQDFITPYSHAAIGVANI